MMKSKLLGVCFTLSITPSLVYPDQPPVEIDSAMIQQINVLSEVSGVDLYEVPGAGGGLMPPIGGGSCGEVADCNPGVGSYLNLETLNLLSRVASALEPDSDEVPGVGGPLTPPGYDPSCNCVPGVGRLPLTIDVNIGDIDLLRFGAEELGLTDLSSVSIREQ